MTDAEPKAKSIDGRARTVRELLDKARYAIDFYQREYAWQERQVRELIDDLTGKFLDSYQPGHSRREVEGYGHCFLGSIVISHKRSQRFIVDGQQRLTTVTLLLIHLHHLQADREKRVDVQNLIFSEKFGSNSCRQMFLVTDVSSSPSLGSCIQSLGGAGSASAAKARTSSPRSSSFRFGEK